jgi:uncharacterized protein DUF6719
VKPALPPIMKTSRTGRLSFLLLAFLLLAGVALALSATSVMAEQVSREQDIVNLRLGQRILVDDGSCPAGQIKEVSGARMTANGILRAVKCVPRLKR